MSRAQQWDLVQLFSMLPDELQTVIGSTTRKYEDNEGNRKEYKTLLFLPSASEVFKEADCFGEKGLYKQLEYYKNPENRIKTIAGRKTTCDWWLGTVQTKDPVNVCFVTDHGNPNYGYAFAMLGVPICFTISRS